MVPPLKKAELTDEEKCRELENKVNELLEKCASLCKSQSFREGKILGRWASSSCCCRR